MSLVHAFLALKRRPDRPRTIGMITMLMYAIVAYVSVTSHEVAFATCILTRPTIHEPNKPAIIPRMKCLVFPSAIRKPFSTYFIANQLRSPPQTIIPRPPYLPMTQIRGTSLRLAGSLAPHPITNEMMEANPEMSATTAPT